MGSCPACGKELPGEFPFCPFCGVPLAEAPIAGSVRERKVVSVLFCDLVGFTASSESADPEEVQARLAPYHARTRERIEAFGGTVEKFIGDAVMAVFGAPTAHEDDPERAVRAGLAVLEAIEQLNDADGSLGLSVRIGVNTGDAVVMLDARPELGEGMVTGDVVNTAARIQAQAPVGAVAVGRGTFQATDRVFEYEQLPAIDAKGKAEPVPVWHAIRPTSRLGSDVIRSMTTPLVGRSVDLALLRGAFDKSVAERSVQLVTVVGEPGVGKSRLVAELGAYADEMHEVVRWRQGRCLPYGEGIAFWALGEIVKAHAGIFESDAPETAIEKLEAALPEVADRPWLRARLLPLIGIDPGEQATHEELFTAWRRFLESIAEQEPLVLVVEDIHWADQAMLDFIEHLADWAQGVALVVVCTARPELHELHPGFGGSLRNTTTINLAPLSESDTARLVSVLLDQALLPAETQQLLLERAGGNPLYAEEFVRMLRDRGLLDARGTLAEGAEVSVPESIQALIAARLDTLPPDRKQLLHDAAVMGKVFWAGAVAAMGDRELREVDRALHELARKELLRPARQSSMEGESEYGFWHLLIRDVSYNQIPRGERAGKHLRAAAWLEQKTGERVEDLAEVLAYHTGEALTLAEATGDTALQAEVRPAAARYAMLAGERALGLDTNKALTLLDRALALTPDDDPGHPLVLLRWAAAAGQAGRLREAAEALEEASARFRAAGDVLRTGEALTLLPGVRSRLGEPDPFAIAEQAVALLEPTPGPELVAALTELAGASYVIGTYETAITLAERALTLAAGLNVALPGKALGFRGLSRCFSGDIGGLTDTRQALEILLAEGKGRDIAVLQANMALVRGHLEGPASALAANDEALAFAAQRGLAEASQLTATNRLGYLIRLGRLDEALAEAEMLLPQLRESGARISEWIVLLNQVEAVAERGGDATAPADLASRIAHDSGEASRIATSNGIRAGALFAVGRNGEAKPLLDDLAGFVAERNEPGYAGDLPTYARVGAALGDRELVSRLADGVPETLPVQQYALSAVRAIQAELAGDNAAAAALYADVAGRWEDFTSVLEQAHALLGEGRCLGALGDATFDRPLREARALFERMGATPRVAECDALLAAEQAV